MDKLRIPIAAFIISIVLVAVIYFVDFDQAAEVYRKLVSSSPSAPDGAVALENGVANASGSLHHYSRAKRPFAECSKSGKPAKSFLMVFMSRSGSTAISQTLAIHDRIENKFEYLQPLIGANYSSAQALNMTRTFFRDAISRGKIPGFKLRSIHISADPEGWAALVREFDTRIIWQYRKNLFKTALGIYAELVYDDYTATGGIKRKDYEAAKDRCDMGIGCSFPIHEWKTFHGILTSRIRQDIHIMQSVRTLDADRDCIFELPYEDYLYHKEETINDLFKFLGLEAKSMETYKVKATADSLCTVVENFDELCDNFYGCPVWQPFLEDFENDCRCVNFKHGSSEYCSTFGEKEMAALNAGNY